MKKNVMMRLASFLLVAVLISTSAISGTYAKYVTTAEGTESARVAEWGVEVGVAGLRDDDTGMFATTYAKDSETSIDLTVEAEDKVVAPGTKKENAVSFTLKGQPEVAVKIDLVVDVESDVVLPAGDDYVDWTESVDGAYSKTFDLDEDYYPVVFTLKDTKTDSVVKTGNLADIKACLEAVNGKEYGANTNLNNLFGHAGDGEYTLSWEWAFNGNDQADTYLGNVAAGTQVDANAVTELDFSISITVTQIN